MKKITLFALLLGMLSLVNANHLVYANTPLEVLHISPELEQELINISKHHIKEMANGDFITISNRFTPELLDVFSAYELKKSWDDITSPYGDYKGIYSAHLTSAFGLPAIEILVELQYGSVYTTIVYNFDNEIYGVSFIPTHETRYEGLISNEYFEEIPLTIGEEHKLDVILTLPTNVDNSPVAILVQGSGQTYMNFSLGYIQPFKNIAHGLAENGIASIRYNENYSQHNPARNIISTQDEILNEVYIAIELADSYKNLGDIYIVGLNLLGMLEPLIASENENVSGIVSFAATPKRLEEYLSLPISGRPVSYWISLNEINTLMSISQVEENLQVYTDKDFIMWKYLLEDRSDVDFVTTYINTLDFNNYLAPGKVDSMVIEDISNWINS